MALQGVIAQILIPKADGSGRALAYEVLNVDSGIRNLIRESAVQQIYSAIQTGRSKGMITMNDSLAELYFGGVIEQEEALSKSPRPAELIKIFERNTRR
jgi:twitching motility protein PilT